MNQDLCYVFLYYLQLSACNNGLRTRHMLCYCCIINCHVTILLHLFVNLVIIWMLILAFTFHLMGALFKTLLCLLICTAQ
jgi:hypothetical protein